MRKPKIEFGTNLHTEDFEFDLLPRVFLFKDHFYEDVGFTIAWGHWGITFFLEK